MMIEYCVSRILHPLLNKSILLHHILFLYCFGFYKMVCLVCSTHLKHLKIHKQIHRNKQCKGTNPLRDVPGIDCPLWLRLVGSHYWQRKRGRLLVVNWFVFGWGSRIVQQSDQMVQGISFCQGLLSLLLELFRQWQELYLGIFVGSFHLQLGVFQKHVLPCIATSWSLWF